ncbi:MAG TPA: hypothetical protein VM534_03155, partial [Thermoanaerobaculia bacterium]|nr:hypothetical protein [Thermoanaerobaculia bacterium]
MQFFKDPHYDFIRWRYHAVAISMLLILIGAGFFFTRGINLAIDFAGGANIVLKFREQPPIDELRGTVRDATIQRYGQVEDNSVLIRLPKLETERDYAGETVGSLHQSLNEGAAEGALDLNYAGSEAIAELLISENPDKLPEGPETDATYHEIADAIIAHRSELGLFHQFSEVAEAEGVTPAAAALLQERTFLGRFNVLSQET